MTFPFGTCYVLNRYVLVRVFKVMLPLSDVYIFTLCEAALVAVRMFHMMNLLAKE